jgi:NTP pyrophosphatase (non-canonical NTP hydrolase)
MALTLNGLAKLAEELGELQQVVGKKIAYYDVDIHPDGTSLSQRLEEEMADVLAAITVVRDNLNLSKAAIHVRRAKKVEIFKQWHKEP